MIKKKYFHLPLITVSPADPTSTTLQQLSQGSVCSVIDNPVLGSYRGFCPPLMGGWTCQVHPPEPAEGNATPKPTLVRAGAGFARGSQAFMNKSKRDSLLSQDNVTSSKKCKNPSSPRNSEILSYIHGFLTPRTAIEAHRLRKNSPALPADGVLKTESVRSYKAAGVHTAGTSRTQE